MTGFFIVIAPNIGLCRLTPLAPILHYDYLDDPTGVTKEGGAGPPPAVHAYGSFYREWVQHFHPRQQ